MKSFKSILAECIGCRVAELQIELVLNADIDVIQSAAIKYADQAVDECAEQPSCTGEISAIYGNWIDRQSILNVKTKLK